MKLEFKDMLFGAAYGYEDLKQYGKHIFRNSYLNITNIDFNSIRYDNKFIVYGTKGAGKTALLAYIQSEYSENEYKYIMFNRENKIKNHDLLIYEPENRVFVEIPNLSNDFYKKNLRNAFINYFICSSVFEERLYINNQDYKDIRMLLDQTYGKKKKNLVPKTILKEIASDLKNQYTALTFSDFTSSIIGIYKRLKRKDNKFFVLIDELEFTYNEKDAEFNLFKLKELILAIVDMNDISRENQLNISFILSVRTELMELLISSGHEINKFFENHGIEVTWRSSKKFNLELAIRNLINTRIKNSEIYNGIDEQDEPIDRYLEDSESIIKFFVRNSWARPRDYLRYLDLIKKEYPNKTSVNLHDIRRIRGVFAENSWSEIKENMSIKYTIKEIIALDRLISIIAKKDISINEFAVLKEEVFKNTNILYKWSPRQILNDLYKFGVIGFRKETNSEIIYYHENKSPESYSIITLHTALFQRYSNEIL